MPGRVFEDSQTLTSTVWAWPVLVGQHSSCSSVFGQVAWTSPVGRLPCCLPTRRVTKAPHDGTCPGAKAHSRDCVLLYGLFAKARRMSKDPFEAGFGIACAAALRIVPTLQRSITKD